MNNKLNIIDELIVQSEGFLISNRDGEDGEI